MFRDSEPPPFSIVPLAPLMRLLQHSRLVTSTPLKTKLLLVVLRAVHARRDRRVVVREQLADVGGHAWLDDQQLGEVARRGRQRLELASDPACAPRSSSADTISAFAVTSTASASVPISSVDVDRRHFGRRDREAFAPQRLEPAELEADAIGARRQKARLPVARRRCVVTLRRLLGLRIRRASQPRRERRAGGIGNPPRSSPVLPPDCIERGIDREREQQPQEPACRLQK